MRHEGLLYIIFIAGCQRKQALSLIVLPRINKVNKNKNKKIYTTRLLGKHRQDSDPAIISILATQADFLLLSQTYEYGSPAAKW